MAPSATAIWVGFGGVGGRDWRAGADQRRGFACTGGQRTAVHWPRGVDWLAGTRCSQCSAHLCCSGAACARAARACARAQAARSKSPISRRRGAWAQSTAPPPRLAPAAPLNPATHRVVAAPVQQVEVVVVDEVGRVEDAFLGGRHVAELLAAGRLAQVGRVERREAGLVALRRRGRLVLEGEDARLLLDVEARGQQLLVLGLGGALGRGVAAAARGALVLDAEQGVVVVEVAARGDEAVELLRRRRGRRGGRGGGSSRWSAAAEERQQAVRGQEAGSAAAGRGRVDHTCCV